MANERTLMSYYRAGLALMGIAAFTYKFFASPVFMALSILFLIVGITMAIYGTLRYFRFKKKILRK